MSVVSSKFSLFSLFVDVPDDSSDFLEFIHIVRHYREGTNTPTVLHCR